MFGASMVQMQGGTGGSWTLAIVSLLLLAAVTWAWVASMRRQDRTDASIHRLPRREERKAA